MTIFLRDLYANLITWLQITNASFEITLGFSAELKRSNDLNGLFIIDPQFEGNLDKGRTVMGDYPISVLFIAQLLDQGSATAQFISEVDFSDLVVSELHSGAKATLELDLQISGQMTTGLVASGSLELDLFLEGSGVSGKAVGTGDLKLDFQLSGSGLSALVSPYVDKEKRLLLDITLKGRAHAASIGTGYLSFTDLAILEYNHTIWGSVGSGSLALDFQINGKAFTSVYGTLVLNTRNFALTEYDFNLTNLVFFNGIYIGASATEAFQLTGDTDDGAIIDWYFTTGELNLEKDNVNKLRYAWISYRPNGDLDFTVNDGNSEYTYPIESLDGSEDGVVKIKIGKGIKAKYVKFKIQNQTMGQAFFDRLRLFTEQTKKLR